MTAFECYKKFLHGDADVEGGRGILNVNEMNIKMTLINMTWCDVSLTEWSICYLLVISKFNSIKMWVMK